LNAFITVDAEGALKGAGEIKRKMEEGGKLAGYGGL